MTLKQLADKIGVHPDDLTGDAELSEDLMNEDITDTMFFQDIKEEFFGRGYK